MAYHVYISNSGSNFFSHFLMDEDSGALEPQPNIELEDSPGAVATAPRWEPDVRGSALGPKTGQLCD